jgi:hypothetical protein
MMTAITDWRSTRSGRFVGGWAFGLVASCLIIAAGTASAEPQLQLRVHSAIGYWPLDEGQGDRAFDHSGQAVHGVIAGAEWTGETPWGAGDALRLDGDTGHVTISDDRQIIPRTGDWTVMAWLNITGDGVADTFLQAGLGSEQAHRVLFYNREGELRLWSPDAGNVVSVPGIAGTGWRHVAFRRAGRTVELVIDGKLVASGDAPHLVVGAGLKMGARPGDRPMPLRGAMGQVILFDRALPHEQIASFFQSPGDTCDLVLNAGGTAAAPGESIRMTVRVLDECGRPHTGSALADVITAAHGTLDPPTVAIPAGESAAHFAWTHDTPGDYTITAQHTGMAPASFPIRLVPTPPAIAVTSPDHPAGLLAPDGTFRFRVTGLAPLEPQDIKLRLNGQDVSDRLEFAGERGDREVSLGGFEPNTTYRAAITAASPWGEARLTAEFKTFDDRIDGYRGIWWAHGPVRDRPGVKSYDWPHFKYSGPLSFAWGHTLTPMAVYAPEVNKTFFVYGGDTGPKDRYLMIMISYYDHQNHRVPRPKIVRDQRGVDDPHDNPSLTIDPDGHIWVFIAGRGRHRPGQIFRSAAPYSIDRFDKIISREQTYSQIWHVPDQGFLHLLTLYTAGRELYWETSRDGDDWTGQPAENLSKLAGFGGHYQVSRLHHGQIGTAFNYHPEGLVDRRTNLYYLQTTDFGQTWTTVDGTPVATPLDAVDNPARIIDYQSQGKVVYPSKLLFDGDGHPVILYITSFGASPSPENDPREWKITRWTGERWVTTRITTSDHNYDMGSLYLDDGRWTLIAPALSGPQPYFTGGEVGVWSTDDPDREWWPLVRRVTLDSPFNHGYLRRPHNPVDPFFAMWADSDSSTSSISRLYFTNSTGDRLYKLPYKMEGDWAEPKLLDPPVPPPPEQTWPDETDP